MLDPKTMVLLVALAATSALACSDDDDGSGGGNEGAQAGEGGTTPNGSGGSTGGTKATGGTAGSGTSAGIGSAGAPTETGGAPGTGGTSINGTAGAEDVGEGGTGTGGAADERGGAGGEDTGPLPNVCPALPSVLSLSGCTGIGPLCTVTQDDCSFVANCGGRKFDGTLQANGVYQMAPADTVLEGVTTVTSCLGEAKNGRMLGQCSVSTSSTGTAPATTTCQLAFDPNVLPGVTCMELPKTFEDLVICEEGAAAGQTTIEAGNCSVSQDGCNFQANCQNAVVVTGTATRTGVSFNRTFKALADAQTPTTGSPAFLKGAEVRHSCVAAVNGTSVTGTCSAGAAGRGGVATSVCAVGSDVEGVPATCSPLTNSNEKLFVLDSCELLEDGEGAATGIGEPVCVYRQNNCIWDVQCGNDIEFGGRLTPTSTKVEWRLDTGTPCEASFDQAGNLSGKCTVPNQAACTLASKPPVAGGESCIALPLGTEFKSKGCGGSDPLKCRMAAQHGCNFMAVCEFTAGNPDVVIAGKVSVSQSVNRMSFNGLGDYSCSVQEASATELSTDNRVAGEWWGQCTNKYTGGMCRNNYDATTNPTGFRGLQVFFTQPVAP